MIPAQVFIGPSGALTVCGVHVISLNAAGTVDFVTADGGIVTSPRDEPGDFLRMVAARSAGAIYVGGDASGYVDVTSTATTVPVGVGRYFVTYAPARHYGGPLLTGTGQGPDPWKGTFELGNADIYDGYGIIMASGPWGAIPSTLYGQTNYNGGTPFTMSGPVVVPVYPPLDLGLSGTGTSAPLGRFYRDDLLLWRDVDGLGWEIHLDGSLDGSGVIYDPSAASFAERAADALRPQDPQGEWTATPDGMANWSSVTPVTTGRQTDGTWGDQEYQLTGTVGFVQTWTGVTDASQSIVWDTASGLAELHDASGLVAARPDINHDSVDGVYEADATGMAAYGQGGEPWSLVVATDGKQPFVVKVGRVPSAPAAGTVYVTLTLNGSNEVTAISGPFFDASPPGNSSTQVTIPLARSDGAGNVVQIQIGAIIWRP